MHIELADDYRSCLLQLPHNLGICGRNAIAILIAGRCGAHSGCVEQVFQSDRNAVQWPTIVSCCDFGFGPARLIQRGVGGDGDEGIEDRIKPLNTVETFASQFERRQAAILNLSCSFDQGNHGSYARFCFFWHLSQMP